MKVMVIGDYYRISEDMADRDDVDVVSLCHPEQMESMAKRKNVSRVYPYEPKSKLDLNAARQVKHAIKETKPDLIHAFSGRPLASAVLAGLGDRTAPKLVSFRGIMSRATFRDPFNLITYLHPRVAGHACESNAVRQGLIDSGIGAEKCVTTYGCARPGAFPRPGRAGLTPWDIPKDAFVVGTVAHIRPVKGIDLLLRAAIECRDLENVYWVLIGPIRDKLVRKLTKDSRIRDRLRLTGYRRDAPALISGADVFVMPSRQEGLCRALLESMSQRVCPIVSDAGGMKEAVRHGQDGLVFPREDVGALAEAIRTLHADRDKVRAYAESAYTRACEVFTPRRMCDRTIELYEKVLNN